MSPLSARLNLQSGEVENEIKIEIDAQPQSPTENAIIPDESEPESQLNLNIGFIEARNTASQTSLNPLLFKSEPSDEPEATKAMPSSPSETPSHQEQPPPPARQPSRESLNMVRQVRNRMHLPPGTREIEAGTPGANRPTTEGDVAVEHQPPPPQPSPHKTTQRSNHGFLVTSPTGQIAVPLIHLSASPGMATPNALPEPTLPCTSTQRQTTTKMKTTGHRQTNQPSDPGYETIIRTRAQRSRERAEAEIPQQRSSDAKPTQRRRSTNVPTLPVPRGPDGKFLP